jgi:hypothetical protein
VVFTLTPLFCVSGHLERCQRTVHTRGKSERLLSADTWSRRSQALQLFREAYEPAPRTAFGSLQFRVFGLAFVQDPDIGVGIFPEPEKILVDGFCFSLMSQQCQSAP